VSEIRANKFHLEFDPGWDKFKVTAIERQTGGGFAVMQPIAPPTLMTYPPGSAAPNNGPSFFMDRPTSQAMLDALWVQGFRPTSGEQAAHQGQVSAMQDHIKSLRTIIDRVVPVKSADRPMSEEEKGRVGTW
jgi:hypothetical protein